MVVISQLGEADGPELELLMNRAQIQVVPFNADHMRWALQLAKAMEALLLPAADAAQGPPATEIAPTHPAQ